MQLLWPVNSNTHQNCRWTTMEWLNGTTTEWFSFLRAEWPTLLVSLAISVGAAALTYKVSLWCRIAGHLRTSVTTTGAFTR